jgi:hypothetical protein
MKDIVFAGYRASYWAVAAIILIVALLGRRRVQRRPPRMPTLGRPEDADFRDALQEGYEKVRIVTIDILRGHLSTTKYLI